MAIIKKKKGNNVYYYLRSYTRTNGKIKSKDVYLGTEIPKNIEEIKKKFEEEKRKEIYVKLEMIRKNFQVEWRKLPNSAKEKELQEIAISFTYNTNAIEGSTITLAETREIIHDKFSPNKSLRDVKETEAHSKIFLEMLKKKENISDELLLRWHKSIFGETKEDIAGTYREHLVRVGEYLAPDWQDVKNLMKALIEFINENKKINAVEFAALVHYRFEKIHPFTDGNGRIGRLLMNSILWHAGYPMLIIEYKKRKSYYRALQKDENGFVSYFMKTYLRINKKRTRI